jgi:hypothetical protein
MRKILVLASLLFSSLIADITSAQTVDPCQYGCPKEGCPQCDKGGGPVEDSSGGDANDDDSDEGSEDGDSDEESSDELPA